MRKIALAVLALALGLTAVGLVATHAPRDGLDQGPRTGGPKAQHREERSGTRTHLSPQQILALGCGPLTEEAAEAVLRARTRCGR